MKQQLTKCCKYDKQLPDLCADCANVIPERYNMCLCGQPISPELQKEIDEEWLKSEFMRGKEICICAAVKSTTGKIYRGHRHGDCINAIRERHYVPSNKPEDQGFMTSLNRYVTRTEGRRLQEAAKIKSLNPDGYSGNTLMSEDLY